MLESSSVQWTQWTYTVRKPALECFVALIARSGCNRQTFWTIPGQSLLCRDDKRGNIHVRATNGIIRQSWGWSGSGRLRGPATPRLSNPIGKSFWWISWKCRFLVRAVRAVLHLVMHRLNVFFFFSFLFSCNAADKLYRNFLIPENSFLSFPSFVSNELFLPINGILIFPFNREIGTTTELRYLPRNFKYWRSERQALIGNC